MIQEGVGHFLYHPVDCPVPILYIFVIGIFLTEIRRGSETFGTPCKLGARFREDFVGLFLAPL